ncbi:putative RING-H2 finger protein ATL12 [Ananas comosus]|uniref:Putative RING-H2 finger protein ATL12 n=1 Tax=Ananas comosus TaxID=4615 RepID=A0A199VK71_ANACO|nr:putative RING-H2 finger protein ATL12 [Ananas comosus]
MSISLETWERLVNLFYEQITHSREASFFFFSLFFFFFFFLFLMYAKFCHPATNLFASPALHPDDATAAAAVTVGSGGLRSSSGIDKTIVGSLPFFELSALRRDRGMLECAVCLSRYDDDAELLRLLPGCRHVFHLECINRWLDAHSSCRTKISAVAAAARFNQSGRFDNDRDLLGLFVERELEAAGDLRRSSSRFSIGGSFRRTAPSSPSLIARRAPPPSLAAAPTPADPPPPPPPFPRPHHRQHPHRLCLRLQSRRVGAAPAGRRRRRRRRRRGKNKKKAAPVGRR